MTHSYIEGGTLLLPYLWINTPKNGKFVTIKYRHLKVNIVRRCACFAGSLAVTSNKQNNFKVMIMAHMRFQKRIRLLPFLWLNLSKTGTSVTLGCRFLKVNIGKRGIWLTGTLPRSGLSVRHQLKKSKTDKDLKYQAAIEKAGQSKSK